MNSVQQPILAIIHSLRMNAGSGRYVSGLTVSIDWSVSSVCRLRGVKKTSLMLQISDHQALKMPAKTSSLRSDSRFLMIKGIFEVSFYKGGVYKQCREGKSLSWKGRFLCRKDVVLAIISCCLKGTFLLPRKTQACRVPSFCPGKEIKLKRIDVDKSETENAVEKQSRRMPKEK